MGTYPIGFHYGPGGTKAGLEDYLKAVEAHGLGGVVKSVDDYGPCLAAANRKSTRADHIGIFRLAAHRDGHNFDTPDYSLSPKKAAEKHWRLTLQYLPVEFVKEHTWLEVINEPDKNRAEWLAEFGLECYRLAKGAGYKLAMFGWSTGEPEESHWNGKKMQEFLKACAADRDNLAVALHEYSLSLDLWSQSPWLVGRYKFLLNSCREAGIGAPRILVTEFGWNATTVPVPSIADEQLVNAARMYGADNIVAAIWYLGPGFGDIHKQAAHLVPVVIDNIPLYEHSAPPAPPNPDPAPGVGLVNPSFEGGTYKWGGVDEINCPDGWWFWHATEGKPNNPFDGSAHSRFRQLEVNVLSKSNLPPDERDLFVLDGEKTLHAFKGYGSIYFKLMQEVSLTVGRYRFTVPVFADVVSGYTDDGEKVWSADPGKKDCIVKLSAEASASEWMYVKPGTWGVTEIEFEVTKSGKVELVITVMLPFPVQTNGVFIDDCSLVQLESYPEPEPEPEPGGEPMVDYVVKAHLLPQNATLEEVQRVLTEQAFSKKESVVFSADDAARLVAPGKEGSTVFVWWPERWGGQKAISDWMVARGVKNVVFKPDGLVLGDLKMGQLFGVPYILTDPFNAPRNYANKLHEGTDYDVTGWEPNSKALVLALSAGAVMFAGYDNTGYGNLVIIRSNQSGQEYRTWYGHMDSILVKAGDNVSIGSPIGEVGATGNANGEHVHVNIQVPGKGLSGYSIPDVIDPTPYVPPYKAGSTTPPPQSINTLLGLHASADPSLAVGEIQTFTRAKAEAVKVMSHHNPDDLRRLKESLPDALYIVRVYLSHGERKITGAQFVEWTHSDLSRTLGIVGRNAIIEIHNEPNLADEGMWKSWQNGSEFALFFSDVVRGYKEKLGPDLKFAFPGLSPGGDVSVGGANIRYDSNRFAMEARGAIESADYLGVHLYWAANWPMDLALDMLRWWALNFPGKKIVITEASNNKRDTSPVDKGRQYIDFVKRVQPLAPVVAVTYFVASATNPAWGWDSGSGEVWVGTEIPAVVGSR